jgi:hypothetical protein
MFNALSRNIVGCTLSAPDGCSPEAIVEKELFSSIGSKYSVVPSYFNSRYFVDCVVEVYTLILLHLQYLLSHPLSGARSALPMGVASEAMFGYL